MGISTKTGDSGKTSFFSGEKISKTDLRICSIGTLDELISFLGIARSIAAADHKIKDVIIKIQSNFMMLCNLMYDCSKASDEKILEKINEIEHNTSAIESKINLPKKFIVPGATTLSAQIDYARSIARRLEREMFQSKEAGHDVNKYALIYLNRLSDYLFILARDIDFSEKHGFDTLAK
ncbi:MAG: ATP:cob(I)alamin adenosyltransferase [Deltaproteobacteria bacterium CG07_land_8_20_14_0_80_38_7]|nr:MAG: ATP:cob(I)alamin adenosyltransferase [Deltaproteobacteria bacterium CG07_land_8_20_14_0_80_38_7]